jgi:hypothetical protein
METKCLGETKMMSLGEYFRKKQSYNLHLNARASGYKVVDEEVALKKQDDYIAFFIIYFGLVFVFGMFVGAMLILNSI